VGSVATSEKPNGNSQDVVCATGEVEQSNAFEQGRHFGHHQAGDD
jgi:predicted heme/steroid binding protein